MAKQNDDPKPAAEDQLQSAIEGSSDESTESQFREMFGQIISAEKKARDQGEATAALSEMQDILGRLTNDQYNLLTGTETFQRIFGTVSEAVVQQGDLEPGTKLFDGNGRELGMVPFTYGWMQENYELVDYLAPRTIDVDVNGVGVHFVEGYLFKEVPKVFVDVDQESIRLERSNRAGEAANAVLNDGRADGAERTIGWHKPSPEDLVASGQWADRP